MFSKLTTKIAYRYVYAKNQIKLVSMLSWISTITLSIGTTLIITVLSFFNGFFAVSTELLSYQEGEIRIYKKDKTPFDPNLVRFINDSHQQQIKHKYPYIEGICFIDHPLLKKNMTMVKGLTHEDAVMLYDLKNTLKEGSLIKPKPSDDPFVYIDYQKATNMGIEVGNKIEIMSIESIKRSFSIFSMPNTLIFEVKGIFSGSPFKETPLIIDIKATRYLFRERTNISGMEIKTFSNQNIESLKLAWKNKLDNTLQISSIKDREKPYHDVIQIEKWLSFLILTIIALVAALNVMIGLFMIAVQKQKDIGIMKALGMNKTMIFSIFITKGIFVGIMSSLSGFILSYIMVWIQKEYGIIKLSPAFIIDSYPVLWSSIDAIMVAVGVFIICFIATLYPAKYAGNISTDNILRHE